MDKYLRKISFLTVIIMGLFYSCFDNKTKKNEILQEQYPHLFRKDSIKGIIDSVFTYDMDIPRGGLYIKLKDGRRFVAIRNSYPYHVHDDNELKNLSLGVILTKGDSIFKPIEKDSLYIFKLNGFSYIYFLPTKEYNDSIFH